MTGHLSDPLVLIFSEVLRMSWLATLLIPAVLVLRLVMRRLPKRFSYVLWAAVWLRLLIPAALPWRFGLLSFLSSRSNEPTASLPGGLGLSVPMTPQGLEAELIRYGGLSPQTPYASVDPIQIYWAVFSLVWVTVLLGLLAYSLFSAYKMTRRLFDAVPMAEGVWVSGQVDSPFIFGLLNPRIYLPQDLTPDARAAVLAHEAVHLRRKDPAIKLILYLTTLLHWFNPLVWLAFRLTVRDMEMACDEAVIRSYSAEERSAYSRVLLDLSAPRSPLAGSPAAFGESAVKGRILNVLHYRPQPKWLLRTGIMLTALLIAILVTTPMEPLADTGRPQNQPVSDGYYLDSLLDNRTPYVGDNSRVVALTDSVPYPYGAERGMVSLHTDRPPYGMTVDLIVGEAALNPEQGEEMLLLDGALMFACIDNLSYLEYRFTAVDRRADSAAEDDFEVYPLSRAAIEAALGKPLTDYGRSLEGLTRLMTDVRQRPDAPPPN